MLHAGRAFLATVCGHGLYWPDYSAIWLAACDKLLKPQRKADQGAFFKSVHQTLTRLVLADKLWMVRFARQSVEFAALEPALLSMPKGSDYTIDLHPDWMDLKHTRNALDSAIVQ